MIRIAKTSTFRSPPASRQAVYSRTRMGDLNVSVSIIVPIYNEAETAVAAVKEILRADLGVEREVIVVDDGSTDGTALALAAESWPEEVRLLTHPANRGKGSAVQTGLATATGTHTAIMDADLEYRAADLALLLEPVRAGDAEVVFGSRTFASHSVYSFWYVIGNRAVTLFANALFNSWIADLTTCHRLLPTWLFRELDLREPGFGLEAEMAARLLGRGVTIHEVPISYNARGRDEGKKLTARDGLIVLRTLLRCRLVRSEPRRRQPSGLRFEPAHTPLEVGGNRHDGDGRG